MAQKEVQLSLTADNDLQINPLSMGPRGIKKWSKLSSSHSTTVADGRHCVSARHG